MSGRDPNALRRVLLTGVARFLHAEVRNEGALNLARTLAGSIAAKELRLEPDRSFGQELHVRAQRNGDRPFLFFEGQTISYRELNERAARTAGAMLAAGYGRGTAVGILLPNLPQFLDIVFATQRIGACAVPINTALKPDGLAYILDNAGVELLFATPADADRLQATYAKLKRPPQIVLVAEGDEPETAVGLNAAAYAEYAAHAPGPQPDAAIPGDRSSFLMYTSGTTGHPKGVVYRYDRSQAKLARISAHLLLDRDDIYYTCLPLFHANALMITVFHSLYANAAVALSRRFSAGNFWREVAESKATTFNTIGTMIAIMMKTPPSPYEREHRVQRVLSAACPTDLWRPFEERFGVRLWEAFGAVDGGGFTAFNFGHAPAGSVGKPLGRKPYRLVDDAGNDVPDGTPGELIHYVGTSRGGQVAYHKDPAASSSKVRDGWVYSGDLMRRDAEGFLYFVGRKTDSMRCRGENVSALEIESVLDRHPDVLETAAFGVASELGEQDAMVVVQARGHCTLNPQELYEYAQAHLPRYAVPRYIRIVETMPKTGTHRTIKHVLKDAGVTADTWQAPPALGRKARSA